MVKVCWKGIASQSYHFSHTDAYLPNMSSNITRHQTACMHYETNPMIMAENGISRSSSHTLVAGEEEVVTRNAIAEVANINNGESGFMRTTVRSINVRRGSFWKAFVAWIASFRVLSLYGKHYCASCKTLCKEPAKSYTASSLAHWPALKLRIELGSREVITVELEDVGFPQESVPPGHQAIIEAASELGGKDDRRPVPAFGS